MIICRDNFKITAAVVNGIEFYLDLNMTVMQKRKELQVPQLL